MEVINLSKLKKYGFITSAAVIAVAAASVPGASAAEVTKVPDGAVINPETNNAFHDSQIGTTSASNEIIEAINAGKPVYYKLPGSNDFMNVSDGTTVSAATIEALPAISYVDKDGATTVIPAIAPTVETVKTINATTTEVTLAEAKANATAADFKVLVDGVAVTPTSVTVKAGSADKVYTIVHPSLDNKAGTVSVNGKEAAFDFTAVKVESVMAINLKEVVVTFSTTVDKKSAETVANYTADRGVTFTNPKLSADGKSVTLFASANLSTTEDTTVTVKDVKNATGKVAADSSTKIKGSDSTIPTVESVKALGPGTIVVTFSEPVQNGGNGTAYTIGTTPLLIGASTVVAGSNDRQFTITPAAPLTAGEHTLVVNDGTYTGSAIADYASYNLQPVSIKFNVDTDLTVPAVTSTEFVDQQHVLVKFNKPVNLANNANGSTNFYWNTNGTVGFTQYAADNLSNVEKVDATTYKVKFTGANYLREGKVFFFVTGVNDFNGNAIQTSKTELTATKVGDLTVTKAESPADNQIKLTFARTVDATTANNKVNYEVKNAEGKVQAISTAVRQGTDNNEVLITTTSTLPGGTYTVTTKNVKDNIGNVVVENTKEVTVNDTTPITSAAVTSVDNLNGKDRVMVTFPEAMSTTGNNGIGTKARYETQVAGGAWTVLPATASVTVLDSKRAEIALDNGTFAAGQAVNVRINLIADASGNINPNAITSNSTAIAANAGIDINGVASKVTSVNKIEFNVPRHLASISPADFLINPSSVETPFVPANAEFKNNDNGSATITLTSGSDLKLSTRTYTVSTNPTAVANTKDVLGIALDINRTTATAVNHIAPTVKTFSLSDATDAKIRVDFSKNMALVVASDFRVVVGTQTYTPSVATPVSGSVYDLTIPAVDVNASATVTTVAAPQSEDAVGNKLAAVTTAQSVGNFKVTGLTYGQGAKAAVIEGDETINITFASAIKPESIVTGWNGSAPITVATVAVATATPDSITLPGIGVITLSNSATDVIIAPKTLATATYTLDGNNKLVVKLAGLTGTEVDATKTATSTLTLAATVQSADGFYINKDVTAITATNLADSAAALGDLATAQAAANAAVPTYNGTAANVTLPATQNGQAVTWTSGTPLTITNAGAVTRPIYSAGDASVNMTASVTVNGQTATKVHAVVVNKKDFAVGANTPAANNTFKITPDGYALTDFGAATSSIEFTGGTTATTWIIDDLTYTLSYENTTGVATVAVTGTATTGTGATTKAITVKKDGQTKNLTLNIPVIAPGAAANTVAVTVTTP